MKFRVWNNFHKQWVKAVADNDGTLWKVKRLIFVSSCELEKLYPENHIIQRATESADKTGRMIYEGDIVKFYNNGWENDRLFLVKWRPSYFYLDLMGHDLSFATGLKVLGATMHEYEVVGNMFENPELVRPSMGRAEK
jgi:hypothetical protein